MQFKIIFLITFFAQIANFKPCKMKSFAFCSPKTERSLLEMQNTVIELISAKNSNIFTRIGLSYFYLFSFQISYQKTL